MKFDFEIIGFYDSREEALAAATELYLIWPAVSGSTPKVLSQQQVQQLIQTSILSQ